MNQNESETNSFLKALRFLGELTNSINNQITDLNAVMDDFYNTVQNEIALSPIL